MSATQTQTLQEIILQEAEQISLKLHHKPFAELNALDQYNAISEAKRALRLRNVHIPGECCDCGVRISEDKFQCYRCRKGESPRAEYWLHSREAVVQ